LTENRRRSAIWAGAAAVLTIVIVGLTAGGDSSIGRIDFAWQAVEIQGAGGRRIVRGIADAPLSAGATLRTGERAEAMAWLGGENQVRLAIGGSTNLTLRATNRIRLDGGSVWLSVKPGGEGFDVETPFGDVRVTGTIFGVSVDAESANVEVTEGSVRVEGPRGFVTLGAGERATATATDVSEPVARSEADRVAFWVAELHAAMNRAHAASYIPSVERAGDSPASLKGGRP
jgi:ferric-dicitrate binding protein FerR (iron transport regulator)